jgi:hypothetical protein
VKTEFRFTKKSRALPAVAGLHKESFWKVPGRCSRGKTAFAVGFQAIWYSPLAECGKDGENDDRIPPEPLKSILSGFFSKQHPEYGMMRS